MIRIMRFVLLYLAFVCVSTVQGAVWHSQVETEEVYGRTVKFCTYKKLRLLPRSVFIDYDDCAKCTCTREGVFCATLPTAMSVSYPKDSKCISVRIGCKNKWVFRDNTNRRCPERLIPKEISMVGR